jgi:hypothetical protein
MNNIENNTMTSKTVSVPSENTPVVENTPTPVVGSEDIKSVYYNERFSKEHSVLNDKKLPVCNFWIRNSNVYYTALAIAAECDHLNVKESSKNKMLLEAYNNLTTSSGENVSIRQCAVDLIKVYDDFRGEEFIETTLLNNNKGFSSNDENEYHCDYSQRQITLKSADIVLLVKAFRFYLTEMVKRFFPRYLEKDKWDCGSANYRVGPVQKTSVAFVDFSDSCMKLCETISKFSNNLQEFIDVSNAAEQIKMSEIEKKKSERGKGGKGGGKFSSDTQRSTEGQSGNNQKFRNDRRSNDGKTVTRSSQKFNQKSRDGNVSSNPSQRNTQQSKKQVTTKTNAINQNEINDNDGWVPVTRKRTIKTNKSEE